MRTSERYRNQVAIAEEQAQRAPTADMAAQFQKIADGWRTLAEEAERSEGRGATIRPSQTD